MGRQMSRNPISGNPIVISATNPKPCNCPHRAEHQRQKSWGSIVKIFRRDDFPYRAHQRVRSNFRPGNLHLNRRHKRGREAERRTCICPSPGENQERSYSVSCYRRPGNLCPPSDNTQYKDRDRVVLLLAFCDCIQQIQEPIHLMGVGVV
jgi:hypothetical protein